MPQDPREQLVETMQLLYRRGLINLYGGNASTYDPATGLIYITPSATPKNKLKPDDISLIDIHGNILEGNPSSEYRLHLEIYKHINKARSVVHAHLPYTVAAAELDLNLDPTRYVESKYTVGECVARIPRLPSGTQELALATAQILFKTKCKTAILEGHGAVAYAENPFKAVDTLEGLEFLAKVSIILYTAGRKI